MKDEICGTCKWHHKTVTDDWVCACRDSEYYSDWTGYEDTCDEWEERE